MHNCAKWTILKEENVKGSHISSRPAYWVLEAAENPATAKKDTLHLQKHHSGTRIIPCSKG